MPMTFSPASPLDVLSGQITITASHDFFISSDVTKVTVTTLASTGGVCEIVQPGAVTKRVTGGGNRTFSATFKVTPTAAGFIAGTGSITLGIKINKMNSSGGSEGSSQYTDTFVFTAIQPVAPLLGITGIERSNYSGKTDDGGGYARVGLSASFSGTISAPVVQVDGVTTSANWYTNYIEGSGCYGAISDWTDVETGDTVYGVVSASTASSHSIGITVTDSFDLSGSVSGNVAAGNSYPLNFAAGGNGVGFGVKAEADKFKCSLDSTFSGALKQVQVVGETSTEVPVALQGHNHFSEIYPVGSLVWIASGENIGTPAYNPALVFGGTWSRLDEYFKRENGGDNDYVTSSNYWTRNTTNCTDAKLVYQRDGHAINLTIYFHNKVAIGDTALEILTLNFSNLGINGSELPQQYPVVGWSDGGEGLVMLRLNEDGVLQTYDYVSKSSTTTTTHKHTTIAADSVVQFTVQIQLDYNTIGTSKCDRFLYKRTA